MGLGQMDSHTEKWNLDSYFTSYTMVNSRCTLDINMKVNQYCFGGRNERISL